MSTSDALVSILVLGCGATLVLDGWTLFQARAYGVRGLDYSLLGRWLGHMAHGRFVHRSIASAAPLPGERVIGWTAHYASGALLAALFIAVQGMGWMSHPTLLPAVLFGLATVVLPFFLMQPAMGFGFAASRTPDPAAARLRSLATHLSFGVGLYLTAVTMASWSAAP